MNMKLLFFNVVIQLDTLFLTEIFVYATVEVEGTGFTSCTFKLSALFPLTDVCDLSRTS